MYKVRYTVNYGSIFYNAFHVCKFIHSENEKEKRKTPETKPLDELMRTGV